ncbi:MAG: hypothetical protein ABJA02_15725 [Acidobacteriota bacterium]
MTKKTITKIWRFVIFLLAAAGIFSACSFGPSGNTGTTKNASYLPPKIVGTIADPEIVESSGLTASKCQPDVFWTHNDSGDDAFIYAMNRSGAKLGTWAVPGANNIDWEDISGFKDAAGKCFIYIGEIGDNDAKRSEHAIYRVREPRVTAADAESVRSKPSQSETAEVLRFTYPDGGHDAETLLVDPKTAEIYVMTKRSNGPAGVYRLGTKFDSNQIVTAEKIAEVSMPAVPNGFVTGGDISPDGRRVIIADYSAGYEFTLPEGAANFDEIWKQQPEVVDLGRRKVGESACYSPDGNAIYASSEGKSAPIFEIERRH